ncbi:MAG: hypothetical protein H7Y88_05175 [Phycisphaerales bacterium]|nr:hypothetical protein [Phycisphaerales bacterium]
MTQADPVKAISALARRLRERFADQLGPDPAPLHLDPAEAILAEFVRSFLVWECSRASAATAYRKVEKSVVDFNELRICLPDDLVKMIGPRYARAQERALRLRAALNDLYSRQHTVSLQHLADFPKRDAKAFLDSLDGVPHFVSARVTLLSLSGHAAPVDSRILAMLVAEGLVPTDATPESAAGVLERKVRAGELLELYQLVQAWSDAEADDRATEPLARKPKAATAVAKPKR